MPGRQESNLERPEETTLLEPTRRARLQHEAGFVLLVRQLLLLRLALNTIKRIIEARGHSPTRLTKRRLIQIVNRIAECARQLELIWAFCVFGRPLDNVGLFFWI